MNARGDDLNDPKWVAEQGRPRIEAVPFNRTTVDVVPPPNATEVEAALKETPAKFAAGFVEVDGHRLPFRDFQIKPAAPSIDEGLALAKRLLVYFGEDTTPEQLEREKLDADAEVLRMALAIIQRANA